MGRFPGAGGRLRWFVLVAWLCLVAGAAALGAVHAPGVWVAAAAGIAAALGSVATAWVVKALDKPEGGPAGGGRRCQGGRLSFPRARRISPVAPR